VSGASAERYCEHVGRSSGALYWNRTGRMACMTHRPEPGGEQWRDEGWRKMTFDEVERVGLFVPAGARLCFACWQADQQPEAP